MSEADHLSTANCAFSSADFEELLSAEGAVDIDRLREASRTGIPSSVRGEVWKYLLGVSCPDNTENFATQRSLFEEFNRVQQRTVEDTDPTRQLSPDLLKQLRAEIRRHFAFLQRQFEENDDEWDNMSPAMFGQQIPTIERIVSSQHDNNVNDGSIDGTQLSSCGSTIATGSGVPYDVERLFLLERLILMHISAKNVELDLSAVYLLAPFLHCMPDPCSVYFSFLALQDYIESIESAGMDRILAKFIMLFRTFEPDLCSHFEDEELRPNEWAIPWLRHLLCAELPFFCVLRLWDTYFALSSDLELHMFVCLAILSLCKESLLECDYSELKGSLQQLPTLDVDHLLALANNMQNQARAAWNI
uniref:Rab-GAP TBC domain-containing protein n=1 Tax=Spongospora subterranea TaxID=70186 RepID=A0A0H5RBN5_9EUKA|eukprot:CRZ11032.1 hypothetical protein [Spongospora subterranea]